MGKRQARSLIADKLVEKIKEIDGNSPFQFNFYTNVEKGLKFWDEVEDYPYCFIVPGDEERQYLPSDFKWGFLQVSIKVYVQDNDDPEAELENALADIEYVLDNNNELQYDPNDSTIKTEEIRVLSITTDEGLLKPLGVGDMTIQIRYDL